MMTAWALVWFFAGLASAFVLMAVAILWIACVLTLGVGGAALLRSRTARGYRPDTYRGGAA